MDTSHGSALIVVDDWEREEKARSTRHCTWLRTYMPSTEVDRENKPRTTRPLTVRRENHHDSHVSAVLKDLSRGIGSNDMSLDDKNNDPDKESHMNNDNYVDKKKEVDKDDKNDVVDKNNDLDNNNHDDLHNNIDDNDEVDENNKEDSDDNVIDINNNDDDVDDKNKDSDKNNPDDVDDKNNDSDKNNDNDKNNGDDKNNDSDKDNGNDVNNNNKECNSEMENNEQVNKPVENIPNDVMNRSRANQDMDNKDTLFTKSSESTRSSRPSLFASLQRDQEEDERWQREVALGRRFAFYKFKSELLGTGNFSKVRLATHLITHERVAVKVIEKTKLDGRTQKMLFREIHIMEALSHPSLIRLYEVCETVCSVHLVLECASGGELFTRISDFGALREDKAAIVFAQVAAALQYMHCQNFVHRDVKAENVFFAHPSSLSYHSEWSNSSDCMEWRVKLGDFGFATQIHSKEHMLNTFCGSPPYAAPELFVEDSYEGDKVDIWALGIMLYFMVTSQMPFQGHTVATLKAAIVQGVFIQPTDVSDDCKQLINAILKHRPQDRMSIEQMRSHNWLSRSVWPTEDPPSSSYRHWISDDQSGLTEEEKETFNLLASLGIDEELVRKEAKCGARSPVIGTYRIVMHKRLRQLDGSWSSSGRGSAALSLSSSSAPSDPSSLNTSANRRNNDKVWRRRGSRSKNTKSKLCLIL